MASKYWDCGHLREVVKFVDFLRALMSACPSDFQWKDCIEDTGQCQGVMFRMTSKKHHRWEDDPVVKAVAPIIFGGVEVEFSPTAYYDAEEEDTVYSCPLQVRAKLRWHQFDYFFPNEVVSLLKEGKSGEIWFSPKRGDMTLEIQVFQE